MRNLILYALLFVCQASYAQWNIKGQVTDAANMQPLPFATIKLGNTGQGIVADLNGKFEFTTEKGVSYLEISYLGYEPQRISLPIQSKELKVRLKAKRGALNEVVITPQYEKIKRIINLAIANRDKNSPDKKDWYRCRVYYKMIGDVALPDSLNKYDTSKKELLLKQFLDNQHLLMAETYSIRTWHKPQRLQEDVIGSRLSGFKKSLFTNIITDVLPFHAYTDYLTLNGKDYHNPVSKGFLLHYNYNLSDEILKGKDTVWVISFHSKKAENDLSGTVYINSDGYAIEYFIAKTYNQQLKHSVRIEQQYKKTDGDWFPNQLNYILDYQIEASSNDTSKLARKTNKKIYYDIYLKGTSKIDSVTFSKQKSFHFDKTHTVRLTPGADELTDSSWAALRPTSLDFKEARTYQFMDSFMESTHLDRMMNFMSKLGQNKLPIGPVDMDITRLYTYNKYEGSRVGLGLQTNENVIKWLSIGGWGGYGFKDAHWKYGAFAEAYADRYKEFVIKVSYDNDIQDPGRIELSSDLDKNYLRAYLLSRVDQIESYSVSVKKKIDYWTLQLTGRQEKITPKYDYALAYDGENHTQFTANEVSLNLRYAFAERTAPAFGAYYSTGTKYPIWYGKITKGLLTDEQLKTSYTQALTALLWNRHLNKIGNEHFLIMTGKSWSDNPLPLSKLFAGNGYRYSSTLSVDAFGGMITMYPYDYYMDQFINFYWKHDFDWKLYKTNFSAPNIGLRYNILFGTLNHPEVHQDVTFSVPSNGYHEVGLMLDNLFRLNYFNAYYITFNAGYFYHITPDADLNKNGRIAVGIGIEL